MALEFCDEAEDRREGPAALAAVQGQTQAAALAPPPLELQAQAAALALLPLELQAASPALLPPAARMVEGRFGVLTKFSTHTISQNVMHH